MTGDDARPHSSECTVSLEELMRGDDVIAERNKAKAEEGSET